MLDQLALQTSFVLAFFSFYIIAFLIFTEYRWLIVPYILWQFFDRNAKEQVNFIKEVLFKNYFTN